MKSPRQVSVIGGGNGDCQMILLMCKRAGTIYAAISCKPMLGPEMANQLAASWHSGLNDSGAFLYFV